MITLGIDIGTSSVKAALVGDDDHVIASASRPLTVSRPQSGFSEQDPQHWWHAVCDALDELQARCPADLAETRAIALSGQLLGLVISTAGIASVVTLFVSYRKYVRAYSALNDL